jgi:hypothetical protein
MEQQRATVSTPLAKLFALRRMRRFFAQERNHGRSFTASGIL